MQVFTQVEQRGELGKAGDVLARERVVQMQRSHILQLTET